MALGDWSGTLSELERDAGSLKRFGYLRVRITIDAPMPDLNRRARQLLPNVVAVDAVLPDKDHPQPIAAAVAPIDQFRGFYIREHQREPRQETVTLFDELHTLAARE